MPKSKFAADDDEVEQYMDTKEYKVYDEPASPRSKFGRRSIPSFVAHS